MPLLTYVALHSIANIGIGAAFLIIWRLQREDRWNLLWCLGHFGLAVTSLTARLHGITGSPLIGFASGISFSLATACLFTGMRSFVGGIIKPREVIGLAVALLLVITLVWKAVASLPSQFVARGVLCIAFVVMGVFLLRQRDSPFKFVGVLLIIRGITENFGANTEIEGIDTLGSIANNLIGVATGIALLGAALVQHENRLRQSRALLQARTNELVDTNRRLTDLAVDLERRNQEYANARDQAEAASAAKSTFIAQMSHELRTPLNAVIGFSEIIRDGILGPIGPPAYRDYAADINDSGQHLLDLVNDILDLSRGEAGHLTLYETEAALADIVDRSVSLIRPAAQQAQVDLVIDRQQGSPQRLFADERRLQQILVNLLSNAVKFTPAGGRVSLRITRDAAGGTNIVVEDTGIGMRAEEIPIALEPFGQVDSSLSRRFEGAGIGLPLTRRLVELHGGTLVIVSTLGIGTIVTVTLPAERIRPTVPAR